MKHYCPICHIHVFDANSCKHSWSVMQGLVVVIFSAKSEDHQNYLEELDRKRIQRMHESDMVYMDYRRGKIVHVCGACGNTCPDTSKEYKRFQSRHPVKCQQHKQFHEAIGAGARCVSSKDPIDKVKL